MYHDFVGEERKKPGDGNYPQTNRLSVAVDVVITAAGTLSFRYINYAKSMLFVHSKVQF